MRRSANAAATAVIPSVVLVVGMVASTWSYAAEGDVALPHTFVSGTPARASDVNANFQTVAVAADANTARTAENAGGISSLEGALVDVEAKIESLTPPSNVFTVGQDGADFTSVADALDAAGSASEANPILVHVWPGIFDETDLLLVPAFVSLRGSGPDTTTIRASRASADNDGRSAVVELEDGSGLSDLTIINTGGGSTFAIGIFAANVGRETIVRNVESVANGDGGTGHFGMRIAESDITILDSVLRASGASTVNAALGSVDTIGAFAQPLLKDSILDGDGVSTGFGVIMTKTAIDVRDSHVRGDFRAISASIGGISRVKNSYIETLGLSPVYQQTGAAAILSDSVAFKGGNPEGLPAQFKYVHCAKNNIDSVVDGTGSDIQ